MNSGRRKILVLGLGNPILRDDSVGFRVATELKSRLDRPEVTVTEAAVAGINLLELLVGYDKAIIIDAVQTRGGKPGQVYRLEPEAFDITRRAVTSHDLNFTTALELGNKLSLALPEEIAIIAIEVKDVTSFSEQCTPAVEDSIPAAVDMVLQELTTT